MKQNRILNYISAAGLLLAVCACGKENLNTTADGENGGALAVLPEGTFVVDYSVSDGETSRAFEGDLSANERISSLLYLLYDSEGQLVKEREIPGIGTYTEWPLTRENMSWEQREALKDTLNVGSTYTAVFLANVNRTLFGETQTTELLQNKENLMEAVLYLPQTPFTDSNMYYLWKEKLEYTQPEGASDDSRDNPLSKNIILRRLVSRIDMVRETITDETEDEAVKAGMGTNFDDLLVDGLNNALKKKVNSMKQDGNATLNENCDNLLTLLKGKVGTKDAENTIAGDKYADYINKLVDNFNNFNKEVANYGSLVSPWTAFNTSKFTLGSMHNRMSINDLTSSYDSSITLPTSYSYPVTDGIATWIGFASGILNGIALSGDGASLTLTFDSKSISLDKNEKVSYTCNPIGNISYNVNYTGEDYTVNVDMSTYFTGYSSWDNFLTNESGFSFETNDKYAFIVAIEGVFGGWNNVTLSIKIPTSNEFTYTTSITEQTNP